MRVAVFRAMFVEQAVETKKGFRDLDVKAFFSEITVAVWATFFGEESI